MKIALIEIDSPADETLVDRVQRVESYASTLETTDLIVLPEIWAAGYLNDSTWLAHAESLNGPTVQMGTRLARLHHCYVHIGSFIERVGESTVRNTSAFIDPTGTVVQWYSKVHLFGYQSRESELFEPGESISVTNTPFGRIGSTICYDLRFSELYVELDKLGVDMIIVPAAWPQARTFHWHALLTARAIESQAFIVGCNAAGTSRVVSPWGNVCNEDFITSTVPLQRCIGYDIDLNEIALVRESFRFRSDRLSDYSTLHNNSELHDRSDKRARLTGM